MRQKIAEMHRRESDSSSDENPIPFAQLVNRMRNREESEKMLNNNSNDASSNSGGETRSGDEHYSDNQPLSDLGRK